MKPLVIFYHIYCFNHQYNKWETTVIDQLQKLNNSLLYDNCSSIYTRIIGNDNDIKQCKVLMNDMKKIQIIKANNHNDRELTTLKSLHSFSKENDSYILYIHTKGVTTGKNRREKYTIKANHWRNLMEYFVIEQWNQCIDILNKGYDACGILWRKEPFFNELLGHFSGNFWWANSTYLSDLPEIKDNSHRGNHEFWIGRNDPNVYCFYESGLNHHRSYYPRNYYVKEI